MIPFYTSYNVVFYVRCHASKFIANFLVHGSQEKLIGAYLAGSLPSNVLNKVIIHMSVKHRCAIFVSVMEFGAPVAVEQGR